LEFDLTGFNPIGEKFSSNKPYLFKALYQWILDNDGTPYLLVDAAHPHVEVPNEHVKNGQIVLDASPNAIDNWFSDNDAISFSARFSGRAQNIYIPMRALLAVYAQENGQGMAFPEEQELKEEQNTDKEKFTSQAKPNADSLNTGENGDSNQIGNTEPKKTKISTSTQAEKPNAKGSKVSHLKVIK
jgi:stringent starvation protein B